MKTKFFTLFAAMMLLFGAKAMAQTNGDVNEDGVVNEQDITAIIQIMQEAGGVAEATKYYWYVGQTQPTADNYTTLEGIQQVTDYPTTFEYTNNSGKRGYAYVILHNSKTLTAVEKVSQATVNFTTDTSIPNYTIYKSTVGMAINGVMVITVNEKQTEDTKYYWYVGQEAVTADNYTTLAESSSTKYTTKNYTTEKFGKVYILVPNIVKSIKVKEVNANVYWDDAAMSVTNPITGYNLYTTNAPKGGSAPLVFEYYY